MLPPHLTKISLSFFLFLLSAYVPALVQMSGHTVRLSPAGKPSREMNPSYLRGAHTASAVTSVYPCAYKKQVASHSAAVLHISAPVSDMRSLLHLPGLWHSVINLRHTAILYYTQPSVSIFFMVKFAVLRLKLFLNIFLAKPLAAFPSESYHKTRRL